MPAGSQVLFFYTGSVDMVVVLSKASRPTHSNLCKPSRALERIRAAKQGGKTRRDTGLRVFNL